MALLLTLLGLASKPPAASNLEGIRPRISKLDLVSRKMHGQQLGLVGGILGWSEALAGAERAGMSFRRTIARIY